MLDVTDKQSKQMNRDMQYCVTERGTFTYKRDGDHAFFYFFCFPTWLFSSKGKRTSLYT